MNIGLSVREKRLIVGFSLRKLARMSDISVSALQKIEIGEASPRVSTLQKISSALGVDVKDLLTE